jgi:hypothetical protein
MHHSRLATLPIQRACVLLFLAAGSLASETGVAIAFSVNSKCVMNFGSGGDADFLRRSYNLPALPPNTWVATVIYANGPRTNLPVSIAHGEGERSYPDVTWIFPPTLANPNETIVG